METARKGTAPVEHSMAKDLEALRWPPRLGKRPGAHNRVSFGVKRLRTKGGAPFSAALKNKGGIARKVVNFKWTWKLLKGWLCRFLDAKPAP